MLLDGEKDISVPWCIDQAERNDKANGFLDHSRLPRRLSKVFRQVEKLAEQETK
jgi:hypothetical protein